MTTNRKSFSAANFMSTPKANRDNFVRSKGRRRSCMSTVSAISVESLDNWSVISFGKRKTSVVDKSLKRVRRSVAKKLRLSTSIMEKMRTSTSKLCKNDFTEVSSSYPSDKSFNGSQTSRIISEREIPLFDDYDLVVWEATPEKKSKKKKFFNVLRKITQLSRKSEK